jgi:hypothetical protein
MIICGYIRYEALVGEVLCTVDNAVEITKTESFTE